MAAEMIYLGKSNVISRALYSNGVVLTSVQMEAITKIRLKIGTVEVEVERGERETGDIRWSVSGYRAGEVQFILGDISGLSDFIGTSQKAYITVYDTGNPNGTVWGYFPVYIVGSTSV